MHTSRCVCRGRASGWRRCAPRPRARLRSRAEGRSALRAARSSLRSVCFVITKSREKSATRKCRCKSLLSNQSNKVGPAPTFKAFRQRRTCTMLSESVGPGRLHYGREETRLTVEHHRQRRETLLQRTCRNATRIRRLCDRQGIEGRRRYSSTRNGHVPFINPAGVCAGARFQRARACSSRGR